MIRNIFCIYNVQLLYAMVESYRSSANFYVHGTSLICINLQLHFFCQKLSVACPFFDLHIFNIPFSFLTPLSDLRYLPQNKNGCNRQLVLLSSCFMSDTMLLKMIGNKNDHMITSWFHIAVLHCILVSVVECLIVCLLSHHAARTYCNLNT